MTSDENAGKDARPAKPIIKKKRWPYPIVWIVPLLAAWGAYHYFHEYLQDRGTYITIQFSDASGMKEGETKVLYRGVDIGQVATVDLSADLHQAVVKVQLRKPDTQFSKQGAMFWVVRPEISEGSITGLNTVLSGPYIDCLPGNGSTSITDFKGLDKAPKTEGKGIHVVLKTDHIDHLTPDSPVMYKGIEVGSISSIALANDGSGVDVHCYIRHPYDLLVHSNSQFWLISGVDVKGGLLSGVEFKVGSIRSLISGGVGFATPDEDMGDPSVDGSLFRLKEEYRAEWLKWSPSIPLGNIDSTQESESNQLPNGEDALHSAMNK